MRFDVSDDDIGAGIFQTARGVQHRVGFAHARSHPEENLQAAARLLGFLFLDTSQQLVGIRPHRVCGALSPSASARLSSSTLTRGSPRRPNERPSSMAVDQRADLFDRQASGARDTPCLIVCCRRADVGIEPAPRGRH